MMLKKLQYLFILFLSFHLVFNEPIEIQSFEEVTIQEGTSEFIYQFSEPQLIQGKNPYFYFYSSSDLTLKIIDGNQSYETISLNKNYYFIEAIITDLNPQKYIFQVFNDNLYSTTMTFIDSSRDININIEKLLYLSFKTNSKFNGPPMPLTFNINPVKDKTIFALKSNSQIDILDGEYMLEYCEISENNICEFNASSSNLFVLEKEKNYKFRINCFKESYYDFKSYQIKYVVKEIDFGAGFFGFSGSLINNYFLIDTRKFNTLYLYAHFYNDVKTTFISEEQKKTYLENIETYRYSNNDEKKLVTLDKKMII